MSNRTHIANAVTQYRERRNQADRDLSNMQQLETLTQTLLQHQDNTDTKRVANFHRATASPQFLHTGKPTQHGHWAHSYVGFMQKPSYHGAHRCLNEIAEQTADNTGKHSPQDTALFNAALHATFNHLPDPAEAGRGEQHHMVELAHAVARTRYGDRISQEAWTPILRATVPAAAQELGAAFDPENQRSHPVPDWDRLGRFQYQTETLRALETAKTILDEALARNVLSKEDPTAIEINDTWEQHHETCRRESTIRCAFNAVPGDPLHALANPPRLTPEQTREMALAAHRILLEHQEWGETPDWLEQAATLRPPANTTLSQQESLGNCLQQLMSDHDSWFDQAVQFDDYGQPGNEEFERLNREHARHMTNYARIMVAAATISAVHLAEKRDAALIAAAGTINWQARQELEMFQRHTDLSGRYRDQALSRLETAIAIIQCMPDRVLPHEERQLILENDEQTRDSITKRRK